MEHDQPPSVPDDPFQALTPQAPDVTSAEFMSHSFHGVFLVQLCMLSTDPFTFQCTVQSQTHSIPFFNTPHFILSSVVGGWVISNCSVHKHYNEHTGGHIFALLLEITEKARVSTC